MSTRAHACVNDERRGRPRQKAAVPVIVETCRGKGVPRLINGLEMPDATFTQPSTTTLSTIVLNRPTIRLVVALLQSGSSLHLQVRICVLRRSDMCGL